MPLLRAVGVAAAVDAWGAAKLLLDELTSDARGGTVMRVYWERAGAIARRRKTILAGGLTAENVAEAIATVRPFGVDVSSGVEASPGRKDHDKVARFLANARQAFSSFLEANR